MDIAYYHSFLTARNNNPYVIDGIINDEQWNATRCQVLFILKETYGYSECRIFHMRDELPLWLKCKNKTYTKIAKLAMVIHDSFSKRRFFTSEEIEKLNFSHENLLGALRKCAVIEIKKHSGTSKKSDNREINAEFIANRELLQTQIDDINPNVIIAGSTVCWNCLADKKIGIFREIAGLELVKKHECGFFSNKVFYNAHHPASWRYGGFNIAEIYTRLFQRITQNNSDWMTTNS